MSAPDVRSILSTPATDTPLLDARDLRRTFGETIALDACSLRLQRGEIHALVGENGSGKSTLIKILSGIIPAESGALDWQGVPSRFASPNAAQRAGVATVFQETLVLDEMSVRDNMMLGLDHIVRRGVSLAREAEMVRAALRLLGIGGLDIERPVGSLTLANRQLVGVARALLRPWRVLILDESTSALDIQDRDRLFDALRDFRSDGRSILFVSHRMDEIESLADRATVLRSGRSVATLSRGDFSTEKLLALMSTPGAARAVTAVEAHGLRRTSRAGAELVVCVRDFALLPNRATFDLDLHAGDIVGVAGLEGHGQVAFLECVAGLRRPLKGTVRAGPTPIRSPGDAASRHIAFLPRDRKTEGIFPSLSVLDNVTVSCLRKLGRFGILSEASRNAITDATCSQTKVKMASTHALITTLSGGNQQKALLARLIATKPKVLVLNDPLRGVDLGAKRDLYEVLTRLAAEGIAILLLSTELIELCLLCDRVVVFREHALVATIDGGALDERTIIESMFGQGMRGGGMTEAQR